MHEDVCQFEITMHDFVLDEGLECIEHLNEELNSFLLAECFLLLEVGHQIALIAILEDQVEIVSSFLDVVQFDDVAVVAGLEHFYLIF